MHKIGQSGGFLGRLLGPLLKTGLPLIGNVLKPLAKSVLIPLGLTAAASATDAAIYKKMFGLDQAAYFGLRFLYDYSDNFKWRKNGIMKIVKSLEKCGLLINGASKTIKYEPKE